VVCKYVSGHGRIDRNRHIGVDQGHGGTLGECFTTKLVKFGPVQRSIICHLILLKVE
jgi:hypothetical protein